jgi:hypothetical protein
LHYRLELQFKNANIKSHRAFLMLASHDGDAWLDYKNAFVGSMAPSLQQPSSSA